MVRRRSCPVCGVAHAACGGPTVVRAVDELTERSANMSGEIKNWPVEEIDGRPAPKGTMLRYTDEEAERLGLKKSVGTAKAQPEPDPPSEDSGVVTSKRARSAKRAAPRGQK